MSISSVRVVPFSPPDNNGGKNNSGSDSNLNALFGSGEERPGRFAIHFIDEKKNVVGWYSVVVPGEFVREGETASTSIEGGIGEVRVKFWKVR